MFDSHRAAGRVDAAYCVASALAFLQQSTPDQQAWVAHYRPRTFVPLPRPLTEDALRKYVFPPELDPLVTSIFGLVAPAIAQWRATEVPPFLTHPIDPRRDSSPTARKVNLVCSQLQIVPPEIYLRETERGDFAYLNVHRAGHLRPSAIVYGSFLHGKSEVDLAYALGRNLINFYLPFYCFVALDRSPEDLALVFNACLRAAGVPLHGDLARLDVIATQITSRTAPALLDQLRDLVERFVGGGEAFDVHRWILIAQYAACRVGLVLSRDLHSAAKILSPLPDARAKIIDLVKFSVSDGYFAARKAVGVAIPAPC